MQDVDLENSCRRHGFSRYTKIAEITTINVITFDSKMSKWLICLIKDNSKVFRKRKIYQISNHWKWKNKMTRYQYTLMWTAECSLYDEDAAPVTSQQYSCMHNTCLRTMIRWHAHINREIPQGPTSSCRSINNFWRRENYLDYWSP